MRTKGRDAVGRSRHQIDQRAALAVGGQGNFLAGQGARHENFLAVDFGYALALVAEGADFGCQIHDCPGLAEAFTSRPGHEGQ